MLKWFLSSQQPAECHVMFRGYASEAAWADVQGQLAFGCGLQLPALHSTGWWPQARPRSSG